ncbi:MAG: O-antigen ligase family protein [bacterium]|nr:O-antigen ligase family protein [bacterium]
MNFNSFFAREEWIKIISLIILYYLLVNFIESDKEAERFINIFLLFAFVESIFALGKKFYFGEARLAGTLASPNFLMGFLLPLCVFIPDKIVAGIKDKKNIKIFYYLVLSVLVFISLIYSRSRAGLLLLSLIILFLVYEKFNFTKWFFAILSVFVLAIFLTPNMKRFLDFGNQDILSYYRLSIWKSSIRMISDNFWTGVGLGNFKNSYLAFRLPIKGAISQYGRFAQFAHNEFLELGAEIGFAGIIIGLIFLAKYILSVKEKKNSKLVINIYIAGGLILFQSIFDYNFHHPGIAILFVFLLASQESLTCKEEKIINLPSSYLSYLTLIPVAMFMFFTYFPVFAFYETKLGFNDLQKNDVKSAAGHFERAIKWAPDIAPINSYLAETILLDKNGRSKEERIVTTERFYQQAIYYEHDNSEFYFKLASFYYYNYPKDMNFYLAVATIQKSFIYDPYNAFYPYYLAQFYLSRLKYSEAERYFLKSIELEPNLLRSRIYLDFIYGKEKEYEKSKKNLVEIVRIEKLKNMAITDFEIKLVSWPEEDAEFLEKVKQEEVKK